MPVFTIHHITNYEYDRFVKESVNEIKIFPFVTDDQEILAHDLIITDHPEILIFDDYWGNKTGCFNLLAPHKIMKIESKLKVRTSKANNIDFSITSTVNELAAFIEKDLRLLELTKATASKSSNILKGYIHKIYTPSKTILAIAKECCELIFSEFTYIKGITDIETTVDEILEHQSGVCQDFAHVMLEILRTIGIPSRYVSGYICPNKNGMRGEGATHAWVEFFVPEMGWVGIDPTNNVWVTDNHVKLAVGRNFPDCTPVKGTFKGPAQQALSVYVAVSYEDGQTFENITDVHLQNTETKLSSEINIDTFAAQQ